MRNVFLRLLFAAVITVGPSAFAAPVAQRIDCQFISSPHTCYVSATYDADDTTTPASFSNIEIGFGCDSHTIYDDSGRQLFLSPNDILVPPTSMLPSLTVPTASEDTADTTGLGLAGFHPGCTLVTYLGSMTGSCIVQVLS